jgi:hypothetical protein
MLCPAGLLQTSEEHNMNDDAGGRRALRRMPSARKGLLAIVAGAALLTAGCSTASSSPRVASLGNSNGSGNSSGNAAGAASNGNATQLLDEWATCIRGHGDPSQSDPTIDNNSDIQITMTGVSDTLANEVHGSAGPCGNYLVAASKALGGGQPQPTDNPAQDVKFTDCMRASGFPNYPDPGANDTTSFQGTGIDPDSPAVQNATKTCDKKVGDPYYPPGYEVPGVVIVTNCTPPPGKQCPTGGPGANSGSGGSGGNG